MTTGLLSSEKLFQAWPVYPKEPTGTTDVVFTCWIPFVSTKQQ